MEVIKTEIFLFFAQSTKGQIDHNYTIFTNCLSESTQKPSWKDKSS